MKVDLIVARYNEDLEWINKVSHLFTRIFIYNKGDNKIENNLDMFNDKNKIIYENLKNVGREGHTYLYHIIKNYDNLGDDNIFTQAEPFDHLVKKEYVSVDFFKQVIEKYLESDLEFKGFGGKHYVWYVGINGEKKQNLVRKLHSELFENKFNENYKFNNGGIFGVNKDTIRNRSKDFFKHIINFSNFSTHINPLIGFGVERMWVLFFNKDYISKI